MAKELNVGVSHLIEHLNKKGFKVENKPTTKISAEMYGVLLQEFSQDKSYKQQAEKITIGRPVPAAPPTPAPPTRAAAPAVEAPAKPVVQPEPVPAPKAEPKTVTPAPAETPAETPAPTRRKAPTLTGPKVVGKIDVDKKEDKPAPAVEKKTTRKSTKATPSADPIPAAEVTQQAPPAEAPSTPVAEIPAPPTSPAPKPEETESNVRKTEYKELSGPKIIGKVDLSKVNDRPANYSDIIRGGNDTANKRPRKRIYTSDGPPRPGQGGPGGAPGTAPRPGGGGGYGGGRPGGPGGRPGGPGGRPGDRGPRPGGRDDRRAAPRDPNVPQEVSEKQIQDKIKETMQRLSGGAQRGRGGNKPKFSRRDRQEEEAAAEAATSNKLQVTEFISVAELASLLNVPVVEIIKTCMSLGIIVSINQRLDAEIIELVGHEFGKDIEFISVEQQMEMEEDEEDDPADLKPRAPIVTIMGHVDHGKTSLLDYIRNANVVAGEAGGITQHIGAYEVEKNGKHITFLDTPGHEAFTAMRARGAKITDVAVIVIAADDAIMPQTREAISHAQAAGVPIIFAFNKMDKPGANAENIRQQLASMNFLVEEWGGKYQTQEISAKTGQNVDLLLEKILLEAEILDLKANPDKAANGSVLEATLDKGRGYVTTLLVQEGTLEVGDFIVAGHHFGRIKAMMNERGARVKSAGPATPVQVLGLQGAPQAGEKFKAYGDEQEAKQIATKREQIIREQGIRTKKHITLDEIGRRLALGNFKELNVIVKGDFDGSVEALSDSLLKLSNQEIQINIVFRGVGQITETDVLLASASDAIIVGFQVRPSLQARKLAEKENIEIRLYSIIYQAIEELKAAMEGMLEPKVEEKVVCTVEVREVFKITGVGSVAGCFVTDGKITRNTKVHVVRDGIVIFTGELSSLKRFKDDVREVTAGMECGLTVKNFNDIKVGDVVEGYEEVEVKRTL